MASLFERGIETLKGVGEKRKKLFEKLGAPTVGDLLATVLILAAAGYLFHAFSRAAFSNSYTGLFFKVFREQFLLPPIKVLNNSYKDT